MMWANINHCPKKAHKNHSAHGSDHSNKPIGKSPSFKTLPAIHEEPHKPAGVQRSPSSLSESHLVGHDYDFKSNIVVYADCHKASRGLFAGMLLLILKIVFVIMLHIAANNP